jgi:hypothetical protein
MNKLIAIVHLVSRKHEAATRVVKLPNKNGRKINLKQLHKTDSFYFCQLVIFIYLVFYLNSQ